MMETKEPKENASWWATPLGILFFIAGRALLELWLIKPVAAGISIMLALFFAFKFIPKPRLRFITSIFLSVIITASYVVTIHGIPYFLCQRIGVIWTAGLSSALFILLLLWIIRFIHSQSKNGLLLLMVTSLGFGLLGMILAYFNPEGVCK
jgi:hypothetical protein